MSKLKTSYSENERLGLDNYAILCKSVNAIQRIHQHPWLHPILLGIFPPLFLLAHNIVEIPFKDGVRSILIVTIGVMGLLVGLNWILKNPCKAGLMASLLVVVFFSYGHVYLSIKNLQLSGTLVGRSRFLIPAYLLVTAMISWIILRQKVFKPSLTLTLNTISILLCAISLTQIVWVQAQKYFVAFGSNLEQAQASDSQKELAYPDIYYIILDGYPRGDILSKTFDYDNSVFLDWLEENDFYVAHCSQSNYSNTKPSMASTLNMTYLGSAAQPNRIVYDEATLISMIENSEVQKIVENLGYKTITFETGYKWLKWSEPDYQFSAFSDNDQKYKFTGLNSYEVLLIKTTLASILFDRIDFEDLLSINSRKVQQARILYIFEKLSEIPDTIPGPKFIYAHVTSPHPPYIFGPNGRLLLNQPENEIIGYREQVNHINTLVTEAVEAIIQKSERPPVIIIQGDHGAAFDYESVHANVIERLAILNAYRLPGADPNQLYASISPVNTFKLVFSIYFAGENELLEDVSIIGNESPFQQLDCDANR